MNSTNTLLFDLSKRWVLALIAFFACLIAAYVISFILKKIGANASIQKSRIYRLISGSQKTILIVVGAISALGTIGVNINALVAGLGLSGFALGLALKDLVSNLISGIMIIIYRPLDIGEEVDVAGSRGVVEDINLRYVQLKSGNDVVLIPNSILVNNKVIIINPVQR